MNRAQRRASGSSSPSHCHKLISNLAHEMAGVWYDEVAFHDNQFYAQWPSVDQFVRMNWGLFVKQARDQLAAMLGMNSVTQHVKDEIYEALLQDRVLH